MTPHTSTLAWKIPWMEEPGRLQSMGLLRVGHNWVTSLPLSLSCIGEGNGNPLQCSCLENPRDGGAWRAAVYGVAQSRTWLKWLSSSSSNFWVLLIPVFNIFVWFGPVVLSSLYFFLHCPRSSMKSSRYTLLQIWLWNTIQFFPKKKKSVQFLTSWNTKIWYKSNIHIQIPDLCFTWHRRPQFRVQQACIHSLKP